MEQSRRGLRKSYNSDWRGARKENNERPYTGVKEEPGVDLRAIRCARRRNLEHGLSLGNGVFEAPGAGCAPPAERNRIYHKGG